MRLSPLLLAIPLAACGTGGGTNFSISAEGNEGNVVISADENGKTQIKGSGFEGSISLPKFKMKADDFDVNGVKLYPGSELHDFNINASDSGGKDDGRVSLTFTSPAALEKVQDWFRDKMAERDFKVKPQGNGFTGTTDEGDPISLTLDADGADHTKGTLKVGK